MNIFNNDIFAGIIGGAILIVVILILTYYIILLGFYFKDKKNVFSSDWIPFNYKKSKHSKENFEKMETNIIVVGSICVLAGLAFAGITYGQNNNSKFKDRSS
jgi:SNF family Na+-dependent transporter